MDYRAIIRLFGNVQGTNLRAMVKMTALTLHLRGYVKNEEDGSVEIFSEGKKEDIESFIRWLNERRGHEKIEKIEDYWSDSKNEFDDFVIRY